MSEDYETRLKTGRNDSCPCGSGKKYKKCHLEEDERARHSALVALEEAAKARAAAKAAEENEEEDAEAAPAGAKRAAPTRNDRGRPAPKKGAAAGATGAKPNNLPRRGAV